MRPTQVKPRELDHCFDRRRDSHRLTSALASVRHANPPGAFAMINYEFIARVGAGG